MIHSLKIRLFPDQQQEAKMWQHIGASRYIWNYMLAEQKRRYEAGEKYLSAFDMCKVFVGMKKKPEYNWLNDISSHTLQVVCLDISKAYCNFFEGRSGLPKFKRRKCGGGSVAEIVSHLI